ncbi:MAG: type II secretion system F family protein [Planctomycetales bacterium]|nr:type II secretion system F family protein [Planctomycetales bacterium]
MNSLVNWLRDAMQNVRADISSFIGWLREPRWRLSPWWPGEGRAARQRTLLKILAAGVQQRANLGALVGALAEEHAWFYRRRLKQLAARLHAGTPLADAVEQTPGALSNAGVLAARFGSQSGTLAASLGELAARDQTATYAIRRRFRTARLYVIGMAIAAGVVVAFLLVHIAPNFVEIFNDFDLEISRVFNAFIEFGRVVAGLALPLVMAAACVGAWMLVSRSLRWRPLLSSIAPRLIRPLASLRIGDLWGHLATAAAAGRPLEGAVSTLARYHYDPPIRRKLLFVRNEIDHGADLYESLAAVRLASAEEVQALRHAPVDEGPAWTLRQLAAARRQRTFNRAENALDFLFPVVVIFVGAGVLFVALAIMTPLVQLTEGLGG